MRHRRTFNPEMALVIGNRLKQRREEKGFTIFRLASLVPASTVHVRKWEKGETLPTLSKFAQILRALDMNLSDFDEIFKNHCSGKWLYEERSKKERE